MNVTDRQTDRQTHWVWQYRAMQGLLWLNCAGCCQGRDSSKWWQHLTSSRRWMYCIFVISLKARCTLAVISQ